MDKEELRSLLNDELAPMFSKLSKQIEQLRSKKADKQDLDRIYDTLDVILKNQETEQQERVVMNRQLERHEQWHHQTAEHIGLKLEYGEAA